ncbi:splicing factor ptsr1-like protein [Leishmania mexicana MHOM/GT/2001/U1103]|uniref:Splicing factor ptsr1-like protein n=1 Tax=Leishmania mexicana (strain MHOM/GT/2001/U1103) TaxID=929439 RepID=E9ALA4_LEIMU|nr:splicing factor ptsr1-like protein [Leishmania mexicana MHOM/GT/2001/U1103]CBZ23707.1 splicing factor ptsr1-like protein [Leishmania mexicana MHOM/GT/2001/U1103]
MSQSLSRSGSQRGVATRSASRSASGSRSSSNSMRLPEPTAGSGTAAEPAAAPAAAETPAVDAGQPQAPEKEVASIFIGMGPAGRNVTLAELTEYLKSKAIDPANVKDVRLRGRCAFADTTTVGEARHLIAQLDNHDYKGKFRLAVQMSKQTMAEAKENKRKRQEARGTKQGEEAHYVNEGRQVFVNLGPAGKDIPNETIRSKIEAICPVLRFERRGYCMYADVPTAEDTKRVVAALNNMMVGEVRVLVQISTMVRKRERSPQRVRDAPRRGGDRHERDLHHHRRRSDSREGHRRHHRSRRSYTPSSRSTSSYSSRSRSHSRGRRSYSPDSEDSRERRSRRGGYHGSDRRRGGRSERSGDRRERRGDERRTRR